MSGKQANLLDIIENYNPSTVAKQKSLSVVRKIFGQYFSNIEDIKEEGLLLVYPFAALKPQMYYDERVFSAARELLEYSYTKDSDHTLKILHRYRDELHQALDQLALIGELIASTQVDQLSRRAKFESGYFYWYGKVFEGVYSKVIRIFHAVALFIAENEQNLDQVEYSDIAKKKHREVRELYDKLLKHGYGVLTEGCNFTIRNSIIHHQFVLEKEMFERDKIRFVDRTSEEEIADEEFIDLFEQLIDTSSALILACLIFQLEHISQLYATTRPLPQQMRRELIRAAVENDFVQFIGLKTGLVNSRPVVSLEIGFDAYTYEEEWLELFNALQVLHYYYPEDDYNISVRNNKVQEKLHWLIISNEPVAKLFNRELGTDDFFKEIGKEQRSMLPMFKLFLGGKRAALRRGLLQLKKENLGEVFKAELQNRQREVGLPLKPERLYRILKVEDMSHGFAKRYRATIIVEENLDLETLRLVIHSATNKIRKQNIHRNDMTKKIWKGKNAHIVWLGLFTREKRSRDMWYLEDLPYYVCQTEWVDQNVQDSLLTEYDEEYKGIKIQWNHKRFLIDKSQNVSKKSQKKENAVITAREIIDVSLWNKPGGLAKGVSVSYTVRRGTPVEIVDKTEIDGVMWFHVRAIDKFAGAEGWVTETFIANK